MAAPATRQVGDDTVPCVSATASQSADGTVSLSLCNLEPLTPQVCTCLLSGTSNPVTQPIPGRVLNRRTLDRQRKAAMETVAARLRKAGVAVR